MDVHCHRQLETRLRRNQLCNGAGGAERAEQPPPSPPRLRQQLHTCTPSRSSQGSDGGLRGCGILSHNNSASFRHTHHCRGTTAVPRLSLHLIRANNQPGIEANERMDDVPRDSRLTSLRRPTRMPLICDVRCDDHGSSHSF